jgi:hypothetical protein
MIFNTEIYNLNTHFNTIPDIDYSQNILKQIFLQKWFPRLSEKIKNRLSEQFLNWNQLMPDIFIARNDSEILKECLDIAGKKLPLAVVAQISYGYGAGHPYFGIHRSSKFPSEETHTYLYHATPGRVLVNDQASNYFRLDHLPKKPMLYAFWILTEKISNFSANEVHNRWYEHRYKECNSDIFDCSSFVCDIAKYMANISDKNNPFTFSIPSNTIKQGNSDERGMRAILKNTHRPPAALLFSMDSYNYDRITSLGHKNELNNWIIDKDDCIFNITSQ